MSSKRRGLVVLGSGEENPRVLFRDSDQESKTRIRKNALRTGPRQAVDYTRAFGDGPRNFEPWSSDVDDT
ncbi:hypothetical protein TNCV_655191 [Trichonephila clavipes]|nr:hypothetical protein TNCV_655191 [Trichonephila clavipes]